MLLTAEEWLHIGVLRYKSCAAHNVMISQLLWT
jgi:hypothetical protein